MIDIEDFLLELVLEDQGMLGEGLFLKLYDGLGTPMSSPGKNSTHGFLQYAQEMDLR